MDEFRCYYYPKVSNDFADITDHSINYHSGGTQQLEIMPQKNNYDNKQVFNKTLTLFHKKSKQITKFISPLGDTGTIKISSTPQFFITYK